jgi:hypothetical protein
MLIKFIMYVRTNLKLYIQDEYIHGLVFFHNFNNFNSRLLYILNLNIYLNSFYNVEYILSIGV